MRVVDVITKKRQGGEHTDEEISFLIQNYAQGAIPDYQLSAWLMAVVWRGLTERETFALTSAMVASGDTLDLSSLPGPFVDKHSTGGVGTRFTLAVVPILASAGVYVPKMSGRGLGHTGGTLDKLESLGGTRTEFEVEEILKQVRTVGACICAQTSRLVPADRKLYALRDATATVQSLPLIAASIMSKKIAGGCPSILLDVKVGGGAFMKSLGEARTLADLMIKIGAASGRRVVALLSDMDVPLGYNVGNRVEVREVVRLLQNDVWTDARLRTLTLALSGAGFAMAGRTATFAEGMALAEAQISSGAAFDKLCQIVTAQGGDADYLFHFSKPPMARVKWDVRATCSGYVRGLDAEAIGLAAMRLGAGRETKEDRIDPTAGVVLRETVGKAITEGNVVATLYGENEVAARQAAGLVWDAFNVGLEPPITTPVIYETIGLDTTLLDDVALWETLRAEFDRLNSAHFAGRLTVPEIVISKRKTYGGYYQPRTHRIVISWQAYREHGLDETLNTFRHEVAHVVHPNHSRAFWELAQALGATQHYASPPLSKPARKPAPKYVYACLACGRQYERRRRIRAASCASCDSRYNPRYALRLVACDVSKSSSPGNV